MKCSASLITIRVDSTITYPIITKIKTNGVKMNEIIIYQKSNGSSSWRADGSDLPRGVVITAICEVDDIFVIKPKLTSIIWESQAFKSDLNTLFEVS